MKNLACFLFATLYVISIVVTGEYSCPNNFHCELGKFQSGHDIGHTKESTRMNCARQCCRNNECIGFDWDSASRDCWLSKTSWSEAGLSPHRSRWACYQLPEYCPGTFTCEENKYFGDKIKIPGNYTGQGCAEQCCRNYQCIGIEWDSGTLDCWLSKTPWNEAGLRNRAKRWVCQKKPECLGLFICEENKSQPGHDMKHYFENNRQSCAEKCCRNSECIGFDWDKLSKDCWLSKTPWSEVGLSNLKNRWACQRRPETKLWLDNGRCGEKFKINGAPGQCDPNANANAKGPCCSPGGWCGNSRNHCKCQGCVDYRKTETKLWLDNGRCGEKFKINGAPGQCDPNANANAKGPCCSPGGWCGNSRNHCKCQRCVDYREKGN